MRIMNKVEYIDNDKEKYYHYKKFIEGHKQKF